jgi:hypothetical protein
MMTTTNNNPAVAQTIIAQLGNLALSMLGANSLVDLGNGLRFKIKGCRKINTVGIELKGDDTYSVTFEKVTQRGLKRKVVAEFANVYFDQLHAVIESTTGLYTRL